MSEVPKIRTRNAAIVRLPSFRDGDEGILAVAQSSRTEDFVLFMPGRGRPFHVKRVFTITGVDNSKSVRANHAHRKTSEVIFCVRGSCRVHLDDGLIQQDIVLDDPAVGVLTGPNLWHVITDFTDGAVLMALADGPYDPEEYIHDHERFLVEIGTSGAQDDVNAIWRSTWSDQRSSGTRGILKNRLTWDAYRVIASHVPSEARSVLEVGAGTGKIGALLANDRPRATVTLSDVLPESLDVARALADELSVQNVRFAVENASKMSYTDESFDVVVSDAVVQHLPEEQAAWDEMARVLAPGGTLVLSVVNRWNPHTLFKRLQGKKYRYGFERSYSHRDLRRLAERAGLSVVARDGFYPAYGITRLARRHEWVRPFGRIFDRACRIGDRLTGRWISRTFGFELVVVAEKE